MDEGTFRRDGDEFVIEDINEPFEAIRWVNSHTQDHRVTISGLKGRNLHSEPVVLDSTELPDNQLLELVLQ